MTVYEVAVTLISRSGIQRHVSVVDSRKHRFCRMHDDVRQKPIIPHPLGYYLHRNTIDIAWRLGCYRHSRRSSVKTRKGSRLQTLRQTPFLPRARNHPMKSQVFKCTALYKPHITTHLSYGNKILTLLEMTQHSLLHTESAPEIHFRNINICVESSRHIHMQIYSFSSTTPTQRRRYSYPI